MLAHCGLAVLALAPAVVTEDSETIPPALADAVHKAVQEEQYRVAPGADGSWQAANPAQGMSASFSPSAFEVSGVDEDGEPWTLGLRLEGWGRGSSLTRAAEGSCEASGRRMEIRRDGLTEWYVNDELGIEQGFTIASPPGPSESGEPLRLLLAVEGGFVVEVLAGEHDARLTAVDGGVKLSYSGLRAWDAAGNELDARVTRTVEGLAILVDDCDASYPLTVDPWIWIEEAKLTASDAWHNDQFGLSVSLSGDTALVGAHSDDDAGADSGSAYAFVRTGTVWGQQAKLAASGAAPNDQFGLSVSLSGDTALVGSHFHDGAGTDAGAAYVFVRVQPPPVTYCTAKINSLGCTPAIWSTGMPTISGPDDYFVTAGEVLSNKVGIMIWSHGPNKVPFMGGILCVAPPIVRTPHQLAGGNPPPIDCSGSYSFHFSQAYMASKLIVPGMHLYAQYWSRDPGFTAPNNVGLTDGIVFVVGR